MEPRVIRVVGARQHNLRDVTLDIPRDQLVVFTGLSGSGKSSLAFDTIYAEGQRKYVESLSVHARHFLEQVAKPEVERIEGLPPTLAIEQRAAATNPRSTVATTTEIYDFLRVLFARVGQPHCPTCGQPIFRRTVDQIVDAILAYPPDARVMVLSPVARAAGKDLEPVVRRIQREGFVRARVDGKLTELKDLAEAPGARAAAIDVVVDRVQVKPEARSRLADAIEISFALGEGTAIVSRQTSNGAATDAAHGEGWADELFSEVHACPACGVRLEELTPRAFSFNSPYGACPTCSGLGATQRFDPQLVVPNEELSLAGGAVAPWASGKKRVAAMHAKLLKTLCGAFDVKADTPFNKLPDDLRRIVLNGTTRADAKRLGVEFEGVLPNLERRAKAAGLEGGKTRLSSYQSEQACGDCGGARLKPTSLAVRVGGRNIDEMTRLPISDARAMFDALTFDGEAAKIADPVMREIRQRLRFMDDVGLGYLTLNRTSATLSGGEAQRIRLATQLGSGLVGVCYVLDEPTIGLHQRDNERLLKAIRRLVDIGNSVIVVEHDEDVIRAADHLVELGPGAGLHGGRLIAHGPAAEVLDNPASITGRYLRDEFSIPVPDERRKGRKTDFVQIVGAAENNLRSIDVTIPLGVLTAITGVSGSGKSTLISQILLPALRRRLFKSKEPVGRHERLVGANRIDRVIEIDQTPIGRTPRSNPATYTGVFDEIRRLYAKTKEAKLRGYDASRFSFNAKGGRCEACQGQGVRQIEMHFLPDVYVECQTCRGTRYSRETLEVRYRGKSIADVLEMRVEEALQFFASFQRIKQGLQCLSDVGLGYTRLGQPSNTLSGGEAQRVKLAGELAKGVLTPVAVSGPPTASATQRARLEHHTLYVLDEPTTGLHFADIQTLLAVLERLVDMGNSVVVIEHNLDVIKVADWVIDLGPDGGEAGGSVVVEGPPEAIASCVESKTGRYLGAKLASRARGDVELGPAEAQRTKPGVKTGAAS